MTNSYYNKGGTYSRGTTARAETVESDFAAVEDGFDLLPAPTALHGDSFNYSTDTGTANAYAVTVSSGPASPTAGTTVKFFAANANTAASTLTYTGSSAWSAKGLRRNNGDALVSGDIRAGQLVEATYNGSYFAINAVAYGEISDAIAAGESIGPSLTDIQTLADIEDGTVATNAISGLAAIAANVTTVAGISGNVTMVAGISANVTTVAGISANVTTVAGDSADIQTLAAITADISAAAAIDTDISAVAADATDIGTVSTNIANVNTVAGISGNVTTVAGISANVTTVAGISADVTTVATNVADVSNFADKYQIAASDPATRADASALQDGDLYYNTTSDQFNVYDGSAWQTAVFSTAGAVFGPASATDNALVQFDGTTGELVKDGPTIGSGANQIVQRDASGKLTGDGSLLTNLPTSATLDLITETVVSTGVASVEFTGLDTSTYQSFVLEVTAGSHADAGSQSFLVQVSPDSGTTWRTTGYLSDAARLTGSYNDITSTSGALMHQTAIGASDKIYFTVTIFGMSDSSELTAIIGQSSIKRGTSWEAANVTGAYNTAESHDSIRVITTGGNTDGGVFRLYGLK